MRRRPDSIVALVSKRFYYWVKIRVKSFLYALPFDLKEIPYLPSLMLKTKNQKVFLENKIFDCSYFYNEFEILEMRLQFLANYVDKFIVIESRYDLTGAPKKVLLQDRIHSAPFKDYNITVFVLDWLPFDFKSLDERILTLPDGCEKTALIRTRYNNILPKDGSGPVYWINEFYFKERLLCALENEDISDQDTVFISDVDEFWNPFARYPTNSKFPTLFKLDGYIYHMDNLTDDSYKNWTGTCCVRYSKLKASGVNSCRAHNNLPRWLVYRGGWHFSAMGGKEKLKEKIAMWDPNDFGEGVLSDLEQTIMQSKDLRGRNLTSKRNAEGLPQSILQFRTKFPNFFSQNGTE